MGVLILCAPCPTTSGRSYDRRYRLRLLVAGPCVPVIRTGAQDSPATPRQSPEHRLRTFPQVSCGILHRRQFRLRPWLLWLDHPSCAYHCHCVLATTARPRVSRGYYCHRFLATAARPCVSCGYYCHRTLASATRSRVSCGSHYHRILTTTVRPRDFGRHCC